MTVSKTETAVIFYNLFLKRVYVLVCLTTNSKYYLTIIAVVQSLSCVQLSVILWTAAHQASLTFTLSWSMFKLMSIELVMPPNHLIFHPFSSCLQSFPASGLFPMSRLLASSGQNIGASDSVSVPPTNIQD